MHHRQLRIKMSDIVNNAIINECGLESCIGSDNPYLLELDTNYGSCWVLTVADSVFLTVFFLITLLFQIKKTKCLNVSVYVCVVVHFST